MSNANEILTSLISVGAFQAPRHPITFGLPFPADRLNEPGNLSLRTVDNNWVPCQSRVQARWSNGSIRWLLLDAVLPNLGQAISSLELIRRPPSLIDAKCVACLEQDALSVDTGVTQFRIDCSSPRSWFSARTLGESILDESNTALILTDAKGRELPAEFESIDLEQNGAVRVTTCLRGRFLAKPRVKIILRVCFFVGTGLVRMRLTIHNPQRARHRGGLWDLGDSNSVLFRDLTMRFALKEAHSTTTSWTEEPQGAKQESVGGELEIYQDSSGGENWQSRNHINGKGKVPCRFRGYRSRCPGFERIGNRASPVVTLANESCHLSAAIPEFWQQFPKAITASNGCLNLKLFPGQFNDLFELQGGEQKTHTIWLNFGRGMPADNALDWVHSPIDVHANPAWYAESGVFSEFVPKGSEKDQFEGFLRPVLEGPTSLAAKREIIDEYGWRNYGDIYADHENAYSAAPKPVISHYNNQFDSVYGCILQYCRTGDSRWRDMFSPLARHVTDIDVYHTEMDRAAYCGGLFWMTDHYFDAGTSTHRTYSRINQRPGQSYGGGPGNAHNFTTGLLYYYYLTGDPLVADAVVSLADWVQRMDDGRLNLLARIDAGPTGLASQTTDATYHGPGRGSGLSINSQLDGWLLTGRKIYLEKAEELIRRCIHPNDDVAARDLLNIELRWSYTVFLTSLARYLQLKIESGETDEMYAYGRASLLHYAQWMVDNERPYFDQRDQMEFPTETWAAQEFRKANVMRLASAHADEPLRSRLIDCGKEFAIRAWQELLAFPTCHVARAVAILLTEGTRDQFFRKCELQVAPCPVGRCDFGRPTDFRPQKARVKSLLRSPIGMLTVLKRIVVGTKNKLSC